MNTKDKDFLSKAQYNKERKAFQKKLADFKDKLNKDFQVYVDRYMKSHCAFNTGQVVEPVSDKKTKYKRFVIYIRELSHSHGLNIIRFGGWWLDNNNKCVKWDTLYVDGIGNPTQFTLSANQKYIKPTKKELAHDKGYHSQSAKIS